MGLKSTSGPPAKMKVGGGSGGGSGVADGVMDASDEVQVDECDEEARFNAVVSIYKEAKLMPKLGKHDEVRRPIPVRVLASQ